MAVLTNHHRWRPRTIIVAFLFLLVLDILTGFTGAIGADLWEWLKQFALAI